MFLRFLFSILPYAPRLDDDYNTSRTKGILGNLRPFTGRNCLDTLGSHWQRIKWKRRFTSGLINPTFIFEDEDPIAVQFREALINMRMNERIGVCSAPGQQMLCFQKRLTPFGILSENEHGLVIGAMERLRYAATVYKSPGMTLDKIVLGCPTLH
jgi:hypothetical protein